MAGAATLPSKTASPVSFSPVSFSDCFMIIPPFGPAGPKTHATSRAPGAAYSDVGGACKQNAPMQAVRQLLET
jgi:hypothetical protein